MFVDASALVAILTSETGSDELLDRLELASDRCTSAIAVYETVLALCRKRQSHVDIVQADLSAFLKAADIHLVAIPPEAGVRAIEAFARYGKGTGHPAQLNMGDCFAYAMATIQAAPLLFKGNDFSRTDLAGTR